MINLTKNFHGQFTKLVVLQNSKPVFITSVRIAFFSAILSISANGTAVDELTEGKAQPAVQLLLSFFISGQLVMNLTTF